MLIVCPSCATAYDVQPPSLLPDGRQVRCVRCRTIWQAEPRRERLVAAAQALAPERAPAEVPAGAAAEAEIAAAQAAADPGSEIDWADSSPGQRPVAESSENPTASDAEGLDHEAASSAHADPEPDQDIAVEGPPIAPVDLDAGQPPIDIDADHGVAQADARSADVETVAAQRSRRGVKRPRRLWSLSRLQTGTLALLIVDCVLVGWRQDIVRVLPQTASLYATMGIPVNLRGLTFDAVTTTTEAHEGVPILVVQGNIVNNTGAAADVPRLKLVVRNAAKQEIYSWTTAPPRLRLSPHEAVGFRTRLASPPTDSSDVLVRFVNRRDAVADTR